MTEAMVTVLVPTYRRPIMLKRALESIASQTFRDFKVYILDNASGDETEDIASEFTSMDGRFHYKRREENIGGVNNVISGLGLVDTQFFCYLADDDLWLPEFLGKAVESLEKNRKAGFFGATAICVDESGAPYIFTGPDAEGFYPPPDAAQVLWERGWPQQAAVLYRSEVLETIDEIPRILGFDLYLLTRIAFTYGAQFSKEPLAFFTINSGSASSSRSVETIMREWQALKGLVIRHETLPRESREAILRAWDKRIPAQIRMMTMLSLVKRGLKDAALGVKLMEEYKGLGWSARIIRLSVRIAGFNQPASGFISIIFRYRMTVFTLFRKLRFFFGYRFTRSGYWWARRLTRGTHSRPQKFRRALYEQGSL